MFSTSIAVRTVVCSGIMLGSLLLVGPVDLKTKRVFPGNISKFTPADKVVLKVPAPVSEGFGQGNFIDVEVTGPIVSNSTRREQFQGLIKVLAYRNGIISPKEFLDVMREKGILLYPNSWPVLFNINGGPKNQTFVSKTEGLRKQPTDEDYTVDAGFGINLVVDATTDRATINDIGRKNFEALAGAQSTRWAEFLKDQSSEAKLLRRELLIEEGDPLGIPSIRVEGGELDLTVLLGQKTGKNRHTGENVDMDEDDCHYGHASLTHEGNNGALANGVLKIGVKHPEATRLLDKIRTMVFKLPTLEQGRGEPFILGLSWSRIGINAPNSNAVLRKIMDAETRRVRKLDEGSPVNEHVEVPFERFIALVEAQLITTEALTL